MPIYCYECEKCGRTFELLVGVGAQQSGPRCAKCGSKKLQRLMSGFAIGGGGTGGGGGSSCSSCSRGSCRGCHH